MGSYPDGTIIKITIIIITHARCATPSTPPHRRPHGASTSFEIMCDSFCLVFYRLWIYYIYICPKARSANINHHDHHMCESPHVTCAWDGIPRATWCHRVRFTIFIRVDTPLARVWRQPNECVHTKYKYTREIASCQYLFRRFI